MLGRSIIYLVAKGLTEALSESILIRDLTGKIVRSRDAHLSARFKLAIGTLGVAEKRITHAESKIAP